MHHGIIRVVEIDLQLGKVLQSDSGPEGNKVEPLGVILGLVHPLTLVQ